MVEILGNFCYNECHEKPWHSLSVDQIFESLGPSVKGLNGQEAEERLKKYGANSLPHEKPYSKLWLFLSQFNNPLIFILLFACGISVYLGHYSDSVFIIFVLLINILVVGFWKYTGNLEIARTMTFALSGAIIKTITE